MTIATIGTFFKFSPNLSEPNKFRKTSNFVSLMSPRPFNFQKNQRKAYEILFTSWL